jgi:hypothetical protein
MVDVQLCTGIFIKNHIILFIQNDRDAIDIVTNDSSPSINQIINKIVFKALGQKQAHQ